MPSVTLTIPEDVRAELKRFSWVNWSEVAREEALKKEIYEKFIRTRKLSQKDQEFCDSIDWHPVDELPLKKSYLEKIQRLKRQKGKSMTAAEFEKWCKKA